MGSHISSNVKVVVADELLMMMIIIFEMRFHLAFWNLMLASKMLERTVNWNINAGHLMIPDLGNLDHFFTTIRAYTGL
jgi:hypothetical protein